MQETKKKTLSETVKDNIRDRGMTISGWARVNEINYGSLRHFLAGRWGTRTTSVKKLYKSTPVAKHILSALQRDELL